MNRKKRIPIKPKPIHPKIDLLGKFLDLPAGALQGGARIELMGNREAVVDGCRGVLEYDETVIKLHAGNSTVRFLGRGLTIDSFGEQQAVIKGHILSVEFGVL